MPVSSTRPRARFNGSSVEAEIVPEPSAGEREALLTALAELDELLALPAAYRSPWRLAGLAGDDEDDR
jgi:hypothetical protein